MTAPAWIDADWPAPANVRGLTTLRGGAGVSPPRKLLSALTPGGAGQSASSQAGAGIVSP